MTDAPVSLSGTTLIVGPLQSGKTTLTAETLTRYLDHHGCDDVVVLDLAPTIKTEGGVIGGRLDRFIDLPEDVFYGAIEATGPRSEGESREDQLALAHENATELQALLKSVPTNPQAVFVNDVTIGFQHDPADLAELQAYCRGARCVVMNAYDGDELRGDDPISQNEQSVLKELRRWADSVITL